ncbi:hypothetical protein ACFPRL_03375 [Pseudoclavibacter helvolus]
MVVESAVRHTGVRADPRKRRSREAVFHKRHGGRLNQAAPGFDAALLLRRAGRTGEGTHSQ